jgi:hypothetical protein
MRVRPAPAAHSSNMRRTTAALHLVDAALHMRALTGRQEPHEPRAIRELGADDPVIDVDARLGHRPALRVAYAVAWSICRVMDYASSATAL